MPFYDLNRGPRLDYLDVERPVVRRVVRRVVHRPVERPVTIVREPIHYEPPVRRIRGGYIGKDQVHSLDYCI